MTRYSKQEYPHHLELVSLVMVAYTRGYYLGDGDIPRSYIRPIDMYNLMNQGRMLYERIGSRRLRMKIGRLVAVSAQRFNDLPAPHEPCCNGPRVPNGSDIYMLREEILAILPTSQFRPGHYNWIEKFANKLIQSMERQRHRGDFPCIKYMYTYLMFDTLCDLKLKLRNYK